MLSKITAATANFRDRFIPTDILTDLNDLDATYRYQLLSGMLIFTIVAVLSFALYFPVLSHGKITPIIINSFICLSLGSSLIVILLKLRGHSNYAKLVHSFVASIYFAILLGIFFTGGIHGSIAPVFLPLPVIIAFLLSNRKTALCYATATLLIYAILIQMDTYGMALPQTIAPTDKKTMEAILWIYYTTTLLSLVMLYDGLTRRLLIQRHIEREKLSYIATHDDLTALANRKQFDIEINAAIHRSNRIEGVQVALLLIDLNDFKPINDLNGHHIGDEILKHVAQQMKKTTRVDDITARVGGDEFAVIVQGETSISQLTILATRLCHNISTPLTIGEKTFAVTASIGIAQYPKTRDENHLRNAADMAMYAAKQDKKDFVFFEDLKA
ncbi:MAG: diguanylate cyclase [Pseudomonadales bacterium]|nr:diguanylate cyclase [Pseudomonadales bacterium]